MFLLSVEFADGIKFFNKGWGKKEKAYPVKPLFGVGIGYKRVVSYKPVLVFQKHKHIKLKGHHGGGWGGWGGGGGGGGGGWGWKKQRGHSGGGGGGWGHKAKKVVDHHHFHHHHESDGWGWDDGWGSEQGGHQDEEHYEGWDSNIRANKINPHMSPPLGEQQQIPEQHQPQVKAHLVNDYTVHQYPPNPNNDHHHGKEDNSSGASNHRQEGNDNNANLFKRTLPGESKNRHIPLLQSPSIWPGQQQRTYKNYAYFNLYNNQTPK